MRGISVRLQQGAATSAEQGYVTVVATQKMDEKTWRPVCHLTEIA